MENFSICALTPAGTLSPLEGEFTTMTIGKVTLQTHTKQATHISGSMIITTHRIAWVNGNRTSGISASLSQLPNPPLEDKSSPIHARTLVRFGRGVRVLFESSTPFKDRDRFNSAVRAAWIGREWLRVAEQKAKEKEKEAKIGEYIPRRVGASGVVDRVHARNVATEEAIHTSFASIDRLREQAGDLMTIAKNFAWKEGEGVKDNELVNMMAEMGIISPVTKSSVGSLKHYREELARQIGDFLYGRVVNVGGLMTLSDAYCVIIRNRACIELISPEDFRGACEMFTKLRLAIRLVQLESGVWAISADAGSEGAKAVAKWVEERGCVTSVDLVTERRIPVQRARAMLEQAEVLGLLCRDGALGVRFYCNLFDRFIP